MQWRGRRGSGNVEDRRGMGGGGKTIIGGGIGSVVIVIIIMLLGGNPGEILNGVTGSNNGTPYEETAQDQENAQFVSVVLADTEDVWTDIFRKEGRTYEKPVLVLYTDSVDSACGSASSAVGPFYCPGDHKLYIDLSFYDELKNRFHAAGDFAMAYVIAHEVGHHVQTLIGSGEKQRPGRGASKAQENAFSVRYELQADYFAGVWAKQEQGKRLLDQGDVEEALTAASAVGDDAIQEAAQGYVVPESFTHGTSEQRKRWFSKGLANGTIEGGDTFGASQL